MKKKQLEKIVTDFIKELDEQFVNLQHEVEHYRKLKMHNGSLYYAGQKAALENAKNSLIMKIKEAEQDND